METNSARWPMLLAGISFLELWRIFTLKIATT
jgi:hypothetical protein